MPNFNFSNPVMNNSVRNLYSELYGMNGAIFSDTLEDCPYEVAVLSRLTAYLKSSIKGRN